MLPRDDTAGVTRNYAGEGRVYWTEYDTAWSCTTACTSTKAHRTAPAANEPQAEAPASCRRLRAHDSQPQRPEDLPGLHRRQLSKSRIGGLHEEHATRAPMPEMFTGAERLRYSWQLQRTREETEAAFRWWASERWKMERQERRGRY